MRNWKGSFSGSEGRYPHSRPAQVSVYRAGWATKWCYVDTGLENEEFVEILDSKFDLKPGERW